MNALLALFLALVFAAPVYAGERCITLDAESEANLATLADSRGETPAEAWTWHTNGVPDQLRSMAREAKARAVDDLDDAAIRAAVKEMGTRARAPTPAPEATRTR